MLVAQNSLGPVCPVPLMFVETPPEVVLFISSQSTNHDDGIVTDPPNAFGWCNCTASAMGTTVFNGGTRSTGTSTRRSTRAAASGQSRIFSPRPAGPSCARRAPRILDLDPWEETYLYLRSKFRLLPRDLNLHPNQIQCYLP